MIAASQSRLRTFMVRLCRDYDLADDLAQESFVVAYQKLGSFKATGSFEGWLMRIAYHRFLQHLRDDRRAQEILSQYGEILEIETDRYDAITDIQVDLEKAISGLAHDEAAAITLCHSFGYSHQEVARIMEAPLGTVKSQIKRGKEKLKQKLSPKIPEDTQKARQNVKQSQSPQQLQFEKTLAGNGKVASQYTDRSLDPATNQKTKIRKVVL